MTEIIVGSRQERGNEIFETVEIKLSNGKRLLCTCSKVMNNWFEGREYGKVAVLCIQDLIEYLIVNGIPVQELTNIVVKVDNPTFVKNFRTDKCYDSYRDFEMCTYQGVIHFNMSVCEVTGRDLVS